MGNQVWRCHGHLQPSQLIAKSVYRQPHVPELSTSPDSDRSDRDRMTEAIVRAHRSIFTLPHVDRPRTSPSHRRMIHAVLCTEPQHFASSITINARQVHTSLEWRQADSTHLRRGQDQWKSETWYLLIKLRKSRHSSHGAPLSQYPCLTAAVRSW